MTGGSKLRRLRRFGTVLLVLFVVAQPVAGTAAASTSTTGPDCDDHSGAGEYFVDMFGGRAVDTYQFLRGETSDDGCVSVEEAEDRIANATQADLYQQALMGVDQARALETIQGNHIEDSDAYALTLVEAQVVESMQAGDNLSEAKANVSDELDDYYSTIESNILTAHNSQINHTWYLWNAQAQTDETAVWTGSVQNSQERLELRQNDFDLDIGGNDPPSYGGFSAPSASNYTLINGSTRPMYEIVGDTWMITGMNASFIPDIGTSNTNWKTIAIDNPDTAGLSGSTHSYQNGSVVFPATTYFDLRTDVRSAHSRVHANAMNFTEAIYANYTQSDFEGVETLSGITLYTQFNTDENTTGYYGYTAGKLGLMGIEGNINSSWTIQYTPAQNSSLVANTTRFEAGQTYNMSGTLFTDWDPTPNSTPDFAVNTTYNTSNTDKTVMFVEQMNNSSSINTLEGEFTVISLTNARTGDSVENTSLRNQTRQEFDNTVTIEQLQDLLDYREDVVTVSESGGGGGGGGWNFGGLSLGGAAVGGLLALGAAFVVLGNRPGSGS